MPRYRSAKALGMAPGMLKYKIYKYLREGKNAEEIWKELRKQGEFEDKWKNDDLRYIESIYARMIGEKPKWARD